MHGISRVMAQRNANVKADSSFLPSCPPNVCNTLASVSIIVGGYKELSALHALQEHCDNLQSGSTQYEQETGLAYEHREEHSYTIH